MRARARWKERTAKRLRGRCMGCGLVSWWPLEVHEVERRSQAPTRWKHTCNYLLLCANCHGREFDSMPHAKQLAHKLYWDAGCFDLDAWLRLKDPTLKAPQRVTLAEVEAHLPYLRKRFG